MLDFARKFPHFYRNFVTNNINIHQYYVDNEPVNQTLFGIFYGSIGGIVKIFKKSVCSFNNHKVDEMYKGQVFNLILHECLHAIFGTDEETVSKITMMIGKKERGGYKHEYNKTRTNKENALE